MEGVQPPSTWLTAARWLLQVLIPVVLVLTSVRLLLTRGFIRLEYGLPGFPEDRYGFTQTDPLQQAPIALDSLLNDAGIDFLGDLTFADGSPVYNPRELSHMQDVKSVVRGALGVWRGGALLALGFGLLIWRYAGGSALAATLGGGSEVTLWLMVAIFRGRARWGAWPGGCFAGRVRPLKPEFLCRNTVRPRTSPADPHAPSRVASDP